ncbi:MAG: hypothetical protein Tsb0013_13100 [Phycisphaerales bacterium]
MLEITITAGGGQLCRKLELTGEKPVLIGRSRDCDIRIGHASVSRKHAMLQRLQDGTWILKDLGSTHGCLVGGDRIEQLPIVSGLSVRIGPAKLSFENLADRIGREIRDSITDDEDMDVEIVTRSGRHALPMDDTIG